VRLLVISRLIAMICIVMAWSCRAKLGTKIGQAINLLHCEVYEPGPQEWNGTYSAKPLKKAGIAVMIGPLTIT